MQANVIQTIWIFIRCGFYMGVICLYAIITNLFNRFTRERADNILFWWAQKIINVAKINLTVHNPHQVNFKDGKRYVIMSNHASLYDIPITYAAIPESIRIIAKIELSRIPIFGRAMRAGEVPLIDRHNREAALKTLEYAKEKMNSGLIILIYPEGTRSPDGKLLPLKKGGFIMAIEADAMIVPIVIRGSSELLPKKTFSLRLNQDIAVHIGKPIDASQYHTDQKDELLQQVQQQMTHLLD